MSRAGRPLARSTITRAEALDALKRSGYLLETRLESVLRAAEFRVEANNLIPDPTATRRELDLWAGWAKCFTFGSDGNGMLSMELVIECVNPPQPIAFITKERSEPFFERSDRWDALKLIGNPVEVGSDPYHPWTWLSSKLNVSRYHHYNAKRLSTQYCSFQKKGGVAEWMALHRDDDHRTFEKLCWATDYYIKDSINPTMVPTADWSLSLIYPVLVVQGELFDVRPLTRSARIAASQHIQYCCSHETDGDESVYQIDVVTEKYFPAFLGTLFREMRLMHKRLAKSYDELTAFRQLRADNHARYERSLIAKAKHS